MFFSRRKTPADVLTDPKNAKVNATLRPRAWSKLTVLDARAKFYTLDLDLKALQNPVVELITVARETSGSIGGEHRKDLVEALKTGQPATVGLSLAQPGASVQPAGDAPKRGL